MKYRLTEGKLRNIIRETVENVLAEMDYGDLENETKKILAQIQQWGYNAQIPSYGNSTTITVSFDNQWAYDEAEALMQKLKRFFRNVNFSSRLDGPFSSYLTINIG